RAAVGAGQTDEVLLAGHGADPFRADGTMPHDRTQQRGRTTERSEESLREALPPKADLQELPAPSDGFAVECFARGFLASLRNDG
ncbi:MAG: hypothetical protein M3457_16180, partial [Chloroflexota bacterium]|nr:hypothetical protein [Chloroflexota bacterium]